MKKTLPIVFIIVFIVVALALVWMYTKNKSSIAQTVTNFEECVAAGNPIMESYPEKCRHGDVTYTKNIGNELEKSDLIKIDSPRPNEVVRSPLIIKGEARGNWFFEASFPVELVDSNGQKIAQGIATAKGEWMTTEFVPFEAELTFNSGPSMSGKKGTLILHKDNPSGLPEHDNSLQIPVVFE